MGLETPQSKNVKDSRHTPRHSQPKTGLKLKWQRLSYRQRIFASLVIAISIAALWLAALAINISVVYTNLSESKQLVKEVVSSISKGNTKELGNVISQVDQKISLSASAANTPLWRSGELIPFVGANLEAVRKTTDAVNLVFQDVGIPALNLLNKPDFSSSLIKDGGINLAAVQELVALAEKSRGTIASAHEQLSNIDTSQLLPEVRDAVSSVSQPLAQADTVLTEVAPLLESVPHMLGSDASQHYLVMFQTNAEINPLGGHSQQVVELSIDQGKLLLGNTYSSNDFPTPLSPAVPVDKNVDELFGGNIGTRIALSTSRPDFPTAAQFVKTAVQQSFGGDVDGVLSLDPIAVGYLIGATGDIPLSNGRILTKDNAAEYLLNGVYLDYPEDTGPSTDLIFTDAVGAFVESLTNFQGDPLELIKAITQGIDNRSLMYWSANPEIESAILKLPLSGALPPTNTPDTVIGVYFKDNSIGKMGVYLNADVQTTVRCEANKSIVTVRTEVWSSVPSFEYAQTLPKYVLSEIHEVGIFAERMYIYGPVGAELVSQSVITPSKETVVTQTGEDLGRPVVSYSVELEPQQHAVVETVFELTNEISSTKLFTTPLLNPTLITASQGRCKRV